MTAPPRPEPGDVVPGRGVVVHVRIHRGGEYDRGAGSRSVADRASPARPQAALAIASAVAGATSMTSDRPASATWSMESSDWGSNRLVTTGLWVMRRR